MVRIHVYVLQTMGKVLFRIRVQYTVVESENIVGNRDCYLIESTTQKTGCCNILSIDISKLDGQG